MLVGLLIYDSASGVFSSRQLERATCDSVAFRFGTSNQHPDHDTIASFRRRFPPRIEALFVEVLQVAREMGLLKLGTVGLDGTKIHADASRHCALSWDHADRIEAQLKAEVADLVARAEAADRADAPDGMSIPDELARREERLARIAEAKASIEARAKERHARDEAVHDARMAERDAKAARTGKKPCGRAPVSPAEGPRPGDQVNLADAESRIMPVAGGGFEPCYDAQAAVAADVVQALDKGQLAPMVDRLAGLRTTSAGPTRCWPMPVISARPAWRPAPRRASIPLIAAGRDAHHPGVDERFAPAPPALENPTPLDAMRHRLKTPEGRALHVERKHTPEPVFGTIESVLGFRQFSLRGLVGARGEWSLVTMAWNVKRMFDLSQAAA